VIRVYVRGSIPFLFFLFSGIVAAAFFEFGIIPEKRIGVVLIFILFLLIIWKINLTRLSILARTFILFYVMPFLATIGYLFKEEYYWWPTPKSIHYQQNTEIISTMISIGLIGLIGIVAGLFLAKIINRSKLGYDDDYGIPDKTLTLIFYGTLLVMAYFFSWLNTPTETILVAKYAEEQSISIANSLNFNASYLVSYTLLILLFIDAQKEPILSKKRIKLLGFYGITIIIVVFHQLLRGDRESLGLLMGIIALHLTMPKIDLSDRRNNKKKWRQYFLIGIIGAVIFSVFLTIGAVRSKQGRLSLISAKALYEGYLNNTWTAVLLTDLSLAAKHVNKEITMEYGYTYVEYFLSLPPGFIAKYFDYTRPMETFQGPAHIFINDISAGGIHLPIVPFMNFRYFGELLILVCYGFIVGRIELFGNLSNTWLFGRFMYGAAFLFLPFWIWYGDMYAIRGIMAAILCWCLYKFLIAGSILWRYLLGGVGFENSSFKKLQMYKLRQY